LKIINGTSVALIHGIKEQHMKQVFQQTLLGVLIISLFASVSFAQEEVVATSYRSKGLHFSASLSLLGFVEKKEGWQGGEYEFEDVVIPKLNAALGYQFNPYISLDINAWTVLLLSTAEIGPKVYLTKTRIAPFVSGAVGVFTHVNFGDYEEPEHSNIIYSASVGVEGKISNHWNLYGLVRGLSVPETESLGNGKYKEFREIVFMPEAGIQVRF